MQKKGTERLSVWLGFEHGTFFLWGDTTIHCPLPYSIHLSFILSALHPLVLQGSAGTQCTGYQQIAEKHTINTPLSERCNSKSPVALKAFFAHGKKPEYLEKTHVYVGRTCNLCTKMYLLFWGNCTKHAMPQCWPIATSCNKS